MTIARTQVKEMRRLIEDSKDIEERMNDLHGKIREEILSTAENILGGTCTLGEYGNKAGTETFFLVISSDSTLHIDKLIELRDRVGADEIVLVSGDIWMEWYL